MSLMPGVPCVLGPGWPQVRLHALPRTLQLSPNGSPKTLHATSLKERAGGPLVRGMHASHQARGAYAHNAWDCAMAGCFRSCSVLLVSSSAGARLPCCVERLSIQQTDCPWES